MIVLAIAIQICFDIGVIVLLLQMFGIIADTVGSISAIREIIGRVGTPDKWKV